MVSRSRWIRPRVWCTGIEVKDELIIFESIRRSRERSTLPPINVAGIEDLVAIHKRITHLCKAIYDNRDEDINLDFLIAGALLHDVGKLLEYEVKENKVVKGPYGERFRHPVSGALLAKSLGLPDDIVLIIYAHSHEGEKCKRTPESYIVHHCDFIDFQIRKSMGN